MKFIPMLFLIVVLIGCNEHLQVPKPRELYFRGDHVKALGIPGVITDKRYDSKTWIYQLTYAGPSGKITHDWIPEAAITELVSPSPNRPQAERK